MPDATVDWRDAFSGGLVAGVLFSLAEWPLSFYLSRQGAQSAYYGAAGSLVVLLLWVYYAAHIFFLGAQLTKVLAERGGRHPRPDASAVMVKQVAVDPIQPP
jgi:membrane protein